MSCFIIYYNIVRVTCKTHTKSQISWVNAFWETYFSKWTRKIKKKNNILVSMWFEKFRINAVQNRLKYFYCSRLLPCLFFNKKYFKCHKDDSHYCLTTWPCLLLQYFGACVYNLQWKLHFSDKHTLWDKEQLIDETFSEAFSCETSSGALAVTSPTRETALHLCWRSVMWG